jgi:tRNA (cytidine32/uridine32-2'-O)-methyltransferase
MIDVQFVLVRPQHSGNVGAVARAMYVCGLEKLVIVDSKSIVDQEALSRSVKASYILNDAIHCDDLSSALSDSSWTIVCSARPRHLNFNCITPDELVYTYQKMPNNSKISIVFGPERTGLTTDEIIMGNQLLSIPMQHTNTSYNLSHAVQLVAYFVSSMKNKNNHNITTPTLINHKDRENWFSFVESIINSTGFVVSNNPQHSLMLIKSIFNRIMLTENELNLLAGVFAKMKKNC